MSRIRALAAVLALCPALSGPGWCASAGETYSAAQHSAFFDRKAEGWYWYIDPAPQPEMKEPEQAPLPEQGPPRPQPPAPFSLSWVRQMLPKYMEAAWNDPTPENVEAYFLVQRFAMDKANAFSDVAQRVVVGNTALDESMRRPLSMPGATAATMQMSEKTMALMKKVSGHAGIWFFFKSDCRFCEAQAPILGFLEFDGFPVLAISMDGGELQSKKFAKTYQDAGHAARLGVTSTPAVFLVSEEGEFDALGMSVLSLDELRRRILIVAQRKGWITEQEANEAKPIMNPNQQRDLGRELPRLLQAAANPALMFGSSRDSASLTQIARGDLSAVTGKDNFIEPAKLVELVNPKRNSGGLNEQEQQELGF